MPAAAEEAVAAVVVFTAAGEQPVQVAQRQLLRKALWVALVWWVQLSLVPAVAEVVPERLATVPLNRTTAAMD